MSFNIIGEYSFKIRITTMFLNTTLKITNKNLITLKGESFFLNRCINDLFNPIQSICIGNGINAPQKFDEKLGNETKRKSCSQEVLLDENKLKLTTNFLTEDLLGATEIGVLTTTLEGKEILISHDVFNTTLLNEALMYGATGSIELEYSFYFSSSQLKTGWRKYKRDNNVYWVFEPNEVRSVFDDTTNYGLRKLNNIIEVQDIKNSYFHDKNGTKNIYIHLYHENDTDAPNPNHHDILIENR